MTQDIPALIAKFRRFKLGDVEAFRAAVDALENLQARVAELEAHKRKQAEPIGYVSNHALAELADPLSSETDFCIAPEPTDVYAIPLYVAPQASEPVGRLAATEAEHQDFRLQNDKEWRAKIDYQKARVAELEYALETETGTRKDQDRRLEAAEARVAELTDKVEGLEADLDSAVEVAFWHGATEWTRLNYPKQFAALKCG
jgi:BMFP domain-containing protein YqiC